MKFFILIIMVSFFTISCGDESEVALNANIKISNALSDTLAGGDIKVKIYKTDTLKCNELTADCNADLDFLTSLTPIEKTISYDSKDSANNDINIKPGFYLVTAVGVVGEEEKTNTACSCPFAKDDSGNKVFDIKVGDRAEIYLELLEKTK